MAARLGLFEILPLVVAKTRQIPNRLGTVLVATLEENVP
jgi:hypothetical protein